MESVVFEMDTVMENIAPYEETHSSDDYEEDDSEVYYGIKGKYGTRQRGELAISAHEVKARVAECRDRVEQGIPQPGTETEFRAEYAG